MRRLLSRFAIPFAAMAGALAPLTPALSQDAFERRELTIPVRDGTKLFAVALVPSSMPQPLPIMLIRTPYSAAGAFRSAQLPASYRELAEDGYIFVTEDVRGRYGSEGQFIMNGALHDPKDPEGRRRSDRHLGHDRLAREERAEQQRQGRRDGRVLSRLARRDRRREPASRAQGHLAPGADDRHLDGRRLLPSGRVPAVVRSRVRADHGADEGQPRARGAVDRYDRYDWYLRVPDPAGTRREESHRQDSLVDRVLHAPGMGRVVAGQGDAEGADAAGRRRAQRRRFLGPGGHLRPAGGVSHAREAGHEALEPHRARSMVPRRLVRPAATTSAR